MSLSIRGIRHSAFALIVVAMVAVGTSCSSGSKSAGPTTVSSIPATTATLPFAQERAAVRAFLAGTGKPLLVLVSETAPFVGKTTFPFAPAECQALQTRLTSQGMNVTQFNALMPKMPRGAAEVALGQVALARLEALAQCAGGKTYDPALAATITFRASVLRSVLARYGMAI
jgi:hypothetical protein